VEENTFCLISDVGVFERTFKGMYLHIILVQGKAIFDSEKAIGNSQCYQTYAK
jgi:hypothetical protein